MTDRYALIRDSEVQNVIRADDDFEPPDGYSLLAVEDARVNPGHRVVDGAFEPPDDDDDASDPPDLSDPNDPPDDSDGQTIPSEIADQIREARGDGDVQAQLDGLLRVFGVLE